MDKCSIIGIGWVTQKVYGNTLRSAVHEGLGSLAQALLKEGLLSGQVKNYSRFDENSRAVLCAIGMAMNDAGMAYSNAKQEVGLLACGTQGCHEANQAYFKDYISSGRQLARGNLFIYTLPTSPLAEAAIYFGFLGPLLYLDFSAGHIKELIKRSYSCMLDEGLNKMAAVFYSQGEAVCFIIEASGKSSAEKLGLLENIKRLESAQDIFNFLNNAGVKQ